MEVCEITSKFGLNELSILYSFRFFAVSWYQDECWILLTPKQFWKACNRGKLRSSVHIKG